MTSLHKNSSVSCSREHMLASFYEALTNDEDFRSIRIYRSDVYLAFKGLLTDKFELIQGDKRPSKKVVDKVRKMSYDDFYNLLVSEGLIKEDKGYGN